MKILLGDWTADAIHKEIDILDIEIDFCPLILKSESLEQLASQRLPNALVVIASSLSGPGRFVDAARLRRAPFLAATNTALRRI